MSIFFRHAAAMRQHARAVAGSTTASDMASQWANPSDITAVAMVIGGDVVQKALAQTTGCWFTPVCFSFGWVAYSFMALVEILGDGRLLPPPDVACKVINLTSGYARDNKNWVIGRLVRDNAAYLSRMQPYRSAAIRISVWQAKENKNQYTKHSYWFVHIWGAIVIVLQLAIACIPLGLYGDWGVLLVTGSGTILSLVTGALPQWTAEKLPNRQRAKGPFAMTVGNGSKDIMVILGDGRCLDLEEMSTSESPRNPRLWSKFDQDTTGDAVGINGQPKPLHRRTSSWMLASEGRGGISTGFYITLVVCVVQTLLWLALLVSVSALQSNTWFILAVGGIGMFQNGYLAATEVKPERRNLPLRHIETIATRKVMDGLMDLEASYGCGKHLRHEFFPGELREDEIKWWGGDPKPYDEERTRKKEFRGPPRTQNNMPNYKRQWITPENGEKATRRLDDGRESGNAKPPMSTQESSHLPMSELDHSKRVEQHSNIRGIAIRPSTPLSQSLVLQSIREQKRPNSLSSTFSTGSPSLGQQLNPESNREVIVTSSVESAPPGEEIEFSFNKASLDTSAEWT